MAGDNYLQKINDWNCQPLMLDKDTISAIALYARKSCIEKKATSFMERSLKVRRAVRSKSSNQCVV